MAIVSLSYILLLVLVAVFCYILATDDSPDANTPHMELSTLKPGSRVLFLKKYLPDPPAQISWWQYLAGGQSRNSLWIPIKNYRFSHDSVWVQHILDEENSEEVSLPLRQCIPHGPLPANPEKVLIGSEYFLLGTDRFGRDLWSRLLIGTRVSMAVGCMAVILSLGIGLLLGALAGWFGKRTDRWISWLINVIWAIPTLLLVFAITFVLGKGFWQIFIAVGLTMWVGIARMVRAQVLSIRELEYIQAARIMGFSHARILARHILPNIMGPTLVLAAGNFATAILIEAGLSFLGIGIQPPASSWGLMIKENYNFIITNRPLLALIPGVAIMSIVLAFNLLGNALRDALDVRAL